ncbi:MAG TPA: DUF559 domain-containing protein [Verrucomicrobiae bacterium]
MPTEQNKSLKGEFDSNAAKNLLLPNGRRIEDEGAPRPTPKQNCLTQPKRNIAPAPPKPKTSPADFVKKPTDAEKQLWRLSRDRRFNEFKFRRQYACGNYFLDFYCPDARLAVELDGSSHGFPGQQMKDVVRDEYLASQGIKVMRFWNNQLGKELDTIRETIWYELMERTGRTKEIAHYLRIPKKDSTHSL